MMRLHLPLLTLACVLALLAGCNGKDKWPPSWYHGHEGPHFELVKTQDQVEYRKYPASKWVGTNVTNVGWDDGYKQATQRLDDYWKGNNQPKVKIDKTVPTFTVVYPSGEGQAVQSLFTIEYFLPGDLHGTPPAPTAPELGVMDIPAYNVWVRTFGGFATEKDVLDQGFGFMEQLRNQGVDILDNQFGMAVYDDPIHLVNRHNEIWVWEKQPPSMMDKVAAAFREVQSKVEHMMAAS